jgi:hypothetical protein
MEGGELGSSKKVKKSSLVLMLCKLQSIMDGDGAGGVEDGADRDFER